MLTGDVQKKKFPNDTKQSVLKLGLASRVGSSGSDLMTLRSESCSESRVFSVLPGSSEPGVVLASRAPARLRAWIERHKHLTGRGKGDGILRSSIIRPCTGLFWC